MVTSDDHSSRAGTPAGTSLEALADGSKQRLSPPVMLTIAGFDPSSGAGITADLKVFSAHRQYGLAAITALTVQSTQGVRGVESVAPEHLREVLVCLAKDFDFDGIKIGMLGNGMIAAEVACFLEDLSRDRQRFPVVLDPVIRSSSGEDLLSHDGLVILRERLLAQVTCVTPNLVELGVLCGKVGLGREDVPEAAKWLAGHGRELAVVVTGGDLDRPDDYVLTHTGSGWIEGTRVETTADHGTGCAFSSALLCGLVEGKTVEAAAVAAKGYVAQAMRAAYPVGHGRGPMHHLFAFDRP